VAETPLPLPAFTTWDTFPFEGDMKVKALDPPADVEPPRKGEEIADCKACQAADDAYIWVNERWRVRSMDRPTGLPMILILEPRSHLDLGDLPNLLAAELGVMTVRVERAMRSLDGVARVHVNRWGDGAAHLHVWLMARPHGQLQLRGSFLPMWDDILPPVAEPQWRENLALVAAWLADFGGTPIAQPPKIVWLAPSTFTAESAEAAALAGPSAADEPTEALAADAGPQEEATEEATEAVAPAADAPTDAAGLNADGIDATGPGATGPDTTVEQAAAPEQAA
jgi:diadenosine tetraphosphate (Ap4A) HIT family hydrolase